MKSTLVPIDTGRKQPYLLEITSQEVALRGLPEALHGATLVQISDLHGGYGNTEAVYEEAIARVNALEPDILVFTGDFVDDHCQRDDYPMPEILKRFQAKRGMYGCFGNHDHRRGIENSRRMLERAGLPILYNESVRLASGLWLAGIDDMFEGKPDFERAMRGMPEDATTVVLSHNPRLIEKAGDRDVWILSGHTHGAQIALPLLTPKLVCMIHLRCPQVAGWYRNGKARLYVSRGVGVTGVPFRYRCPAEIAVFRLIPDPVTSPTP